MLLTTVKSQESKTDKISSVDLLQEGITQVETVIVVATATGKANEPMTVRTDKLILEGIKSLHANKLVVVASHRGIVNIDHIFVLGFVMRAFD